MNNYLMRRHKRESMMDHRGEYMGSKQFEREMSVYPDQRRDYNDYSDYRRRRDYNDYGDYRRGRDYNDYGDYRRGRDYNDYNDYRRGRDYNDYGDYHSEKQIMQEYERELDKWCHKLKSKDRFNLPKEEVFKKAKEMGAKFNEYDEMDFYVIYLLMMSIFKHQANDPHSYISMALSFLENDEFEINPSEITSVVMYELAKGGR